MFPFRDCTLHLGLDLDTEEQAYCVMVLLSRNLYGFGGFCLPHEGGTHLAVLERCNSGVNEGAAELSKQQ